MITPPLNFDGSKFAAKYGLDVTAFWIDTQGFFQCPLLPDLTDADLADCIADPAIPTPATIEERLEAAELMIDLLLTDTQEAV